MVVIININIRDKLVIIIPLVVIVMLNTPRQSYEDYNRDIENKSDRINRIRKREIGIRERVGK